MNYSIVFYDSAGSFFYSCTGSASSESRFNDAAYSAFCKAVALNKVKGEMSAHISFFRKSGVLFRQSILTFYDADGFHMALDGVYNTALTHAFLKGYLL